VTSPAQILYAQQQQVLLAVLAGGRVENGIAGIGDVLAGQDRIALIAPEGLQAQIHDRLILQSIIGPRQ
jgi:hypothetical protein